MNSQFGCLNLPVFIRYGATTLRFIEFGFGETCLLLVTLLITAQDLPLECFISMFSTVSVYATLRLLLRCSNSLLVASCLSE